MSFFAHEAENIFMMRLKIYGDVLGGDDIEDDVNNNGDDDIEDVEEKKTMATMTMRYFYIRNMKTAI